MPVRLKDDRYKECHKYTKAFNIKRIIQVEVIGDRDREAVTILTGQNLAALYKEFAFCEQRMGIVRWFCFECRGHGGSDYVQYTYQDT